MKKIISLLLATFAFVAVVPSFVACENEDEDIKQEPQITLTTNKKVGETITLRFHRENTPTDVIGATKISEEEFDMDGGGLLESGVVDFVYKLTSQTVVIKGDIPYIRCRENGLTGLDVSRNPSLKLLQCDNNQLTTLNVGNNLELEYLTCAFNQLTQLDVTKNTKLEWLACASNNLTTLDVSKNFELGILSCSNNKLTSLDVSKNTGLYNLICFNNKIKAAEMSKIINALTDWTGKSISYPWFFITDHATLSVVSADNIEENEISEADRKSAESKNWRYY